MPQEIRKAGLNIPGYITADSIMEAMDNPQNVIAEYETNDPFAHLKSKSENIKRSIASDHNNWNEEKTRLANSNDRLHYSQNDYASLHVDEDWVTNEYQNSHHGIRRASQESEFSGERLENPAWRNDFPESYYHNGTSLFDHDLDIEIMVRESMEADNARRRQMAINNKRAMLNEKGSGTMNSRTANRKKIRDSVHVTDHSHDLMHNRIRSGGHYTEHHGSAVNLPNQDAILNQEYQRLEMAKERKAERLKIKRPGMSRQERIDEWQNDAMSSYEETVDYGWVESLMPSE